LISTVLYSLIPYKTPWCAMGFFHGMILLAGVATSRLVLSPNRMLGSAAALVIGVGAAHLVWLNYLGNFRYFCDSRNPWVYAHTGHDIFDIERTVREVAAVHPDGTRMHLQVICPGYDYWPLPWYLRDFPRVGYWSMVQNEVVSAELILAMPAVEEALMTRLFELPPPGQRHMYMPLFDRDMELRPSVEIRGYLRKDLWDRYEARREPAPESVLQESPSPLEP
jgi:predicted membrane-bound mannosyltransferase